MVDRYPSKQQATTAQSLQAFGEQSTSPSADGYEQLDKMPDKLFFKIGEVASIVDVASHVLRYWEREFSIIRPYKSASRHRRYRRKDVEFFLEIKDLLHGQMYTIAGARKYLSDKYAPKKEVQKPALEVVATENTDIKPQVQLKQEKLEKAKAILQEIISIVDHD